MNVGRISILINTRDRWSELGILLTSLINQTYTEWDAVIIDESQTPVYNCQFLMMLFNRIQQLGHKLKIVYNPFPDGVCKARNLAIKELKESTFYDNEFCARLDDDVMLADDYLLLMVNGLYKYDLMSGITPHMASPDWERLPENVMPIVNDMELDDAGNIVSYKDDCGYSYYDTTHSDPLPITNFRSNAVYRTELHSKHDIEYPLTLSKVGFREELWFSIKAILAGYKLGVNLGAKAYHFQTSSGGCRFPDYAECVAKDQKTTEEWIKRLVKEKGNFIAEYRKKVSQ